jgi:hypothetical protein
MKIEGAMNLSMQNEFELNHFGILHYMVRRNVVCTLKFIFLEVAVKITIKFKI